MVCYAVLNANGLEAIIRLLLEQRLQIGPEVRESYFEDNQSLSWLFLGEAKEITDDKIVKLSWVVRVFMLNHWGEYFRSEMLTGLFFCSSVQIPVSWRKRFGLLGPFLGQMLFRKLRPNNPRTCSATTFWVALGILTMSVHSSRNF